MRTKKLSYVLVAGALLLAGFTNTAKASDNGRFSVGAELGLPMGTFGDASNVGFGGSLRYEMPMGDNLALMGTAGYLTFGGKEVTTGFAGIASVTSKSTSGLIPIQVGAKYYFQEQQSGFYGMVQLGLTLINSSTDVTTDILGTKTTTSVSGNTSGFGYAPGVGYHLDNLDFGLSYQLFSQTVSSTVGTTTVEATSTTGYLGLRIAYVFGEK
jgi:hypothetical protein